MPRLHIHIGVDDLEQSIGFYSALFGTAPDVRQQDYAKWNLQRPAVNFALSTRGAGAGLDHLGIQADSEQELAEVQARLEKAGIASKEQNRVACCYARSNKCWTIDPQGIAWETFHTLESIPGFNGLSYEGAARGCCIPGIDNG